jgi:hypothetical protein
MLRTSVSPGKRAGDDKKLARSLEQQYIEEMAAASAAGLGTSPLGPLADSSTRRLLIDLIATMNASFPDHDFSALRPDQFVREPSAALVIAKVRASEQIPSARSFYRATHHAPSPTLW